LGTAEVVFERKADSLRALNQYNGVPLDGRPMKITLFGDDSIVPSGGVGSRVGGQGGARPKTQQKPGGIRGGGGRGRGGSTRGRGRGGAGPQKKTPTAEELDAELDAYASKMDTA